MTADIELRDVTKNYGLFKAVDNINLTIEKGSFVSLLGSSGAGKSTLLRLIGGFEYPDSGSIGIAGQDVTDLPPYKRRVNTVFQNYALFPHMSVAENVAYGLRQARVPTTERKQRVREALTMVEMAFYADRRPGQLSGGQQQRVALARALVNRPSVLLLDEPLGALDRKLRHQVQVELKMIQKRLGLTFAFVTHDQEEALAMSDSIAVMRNGRIEQLGSPAELYDTPSSAFVAGFIGSQNFLTGRAVGADAIELDTGETLRATLPALGVQSGEKVLGAIRPEHVSICESHPEAAPNALPARVIASVMLGDTVELIAEARNGTEFRCRHPRRNLKSVPLESHVWLTWEPEDFRLYPHDPTVLTGRD